jgi:predicted kinase
MNNIAILTIGAPGSGKSTWGEKFAKDNGYIYLSSDRNRARVGTGEEDLKASARAFALLKEEMGAALDRGENVVVDATFMSKKARRDFVNIARGRGAHLRAVVFDLPRKLILERNSKRAKAGGRDVPQFVIDRMLGNYEKPESPEFDEVTFITK